MPARTARRAYNDADATTDGVTVTLSANAEDTWAMVHTGNVTDMSGLGDKAFWDNENTLYVLTGSNLVQVNGTDSQDQSVAIAQPVIAALT